MVMHSQAQLKCHFKSCGRSVERNCFFLVLAAGATSASTASRSSNALACRKR